MESHISASLYSVSPCLRQKSQYFLILIIIIWPTLCNLFHCKLFSSKQDQRDLAGFENGLPPLGLMLLFLISPPYGCAHHSQSVDLTSQVRSDRVIDEQSCAGKTAVGGDLKGNLYQQQTCPQPTWSE